MEKMELKSSSGSPAATRATPLGGKAVPNAGVGVAFLFTNSAEKMSLETPMPFMQYPVQPHNLETVIPCEARTAGVIFYYPLSALIATGVC
jgi:hypothetical protein